MDLLDRYLAAVARDLPPAQRADVAAELRDDLLSMIEAAESRLGRPQTQAELEAMLIAFGHPLQVAGRYRKVQHLIGPAVFPFWWAWLRASLAIVAAIYIVLVCIELFTTGHARTALLGVDASLAEVLVFTFGAVTLIAAGVERWGKPQLLARWTPRDLPPAEGKAPSQFERVLDLAMSVVFLAWWAGLLHFRNALADGLRIDPAPVWAAWFWPILAYAAIDVAAKLVALVKPGRARLHRGLGIACNLAGAAILAGVLRAGRFVEVSADGETATLLQAKFDRGLGIGLSVLIFVFLWRAVVDAWRLRQSLQTAPALGRASA